MNDETKIKLIDEIKLEDLQELSPSLTQVAKILGMEKFINLSYSFSGIVFYIPKFDTLASRARDRLIVKEFNGGNYSELARKYDLTEIWVRQIVNRDRAIKGQITLFDVDQL
ncbi:MAG: Mor transcription activator family protein [Acidaminococcaceae bacterium]